MVTAALCGSVGLVTVGARAASGQDAERTLLAVFAHPDDETAVGPLLARYAREGVAVHLAIATDGQKGVREHAGIPAGEKLAAKRTGEAQCACEALGINPPVRERFLPVRIAYGANLEQVKKVLVDTARLHPSVLDDPPPLALLLDFGEDAVNLELRFVVDFGQGLSTKDEVQMAIERRFQDEGIEFALPMSKVRLTPGTPSP